MNTLRRGGGGRSGRGCDVDVSFPGCQEVGSERGEGRGVGELPLGV